MKSYSALFKTSYQLVLLCSILCAFLLAGCGNEETAAPSAAETAAFIPEGSTKLVKEYKKAAGNRSNTPKVLTPTAPGTITYDCSVASIDASNTSEGYVTVTYTGSSKKVKLQIKGPGSTTYTYDLKKGPQVFPLSCGNGSYTIGVFEHVSGNQYATAMSQPVNVTIQNTFGPFLYPNQYVNFNEDSLAVSKAAALAESAYSDLDVVSNVYNYIIEHIKYDYDKAESIKSGYIPDVDATLTSNLGICLDYASTMAAMLRSQNIPTRLEVGYAGTAYHAWISIYIKDSGWINGMIQFDGKNWELMDPTFAANSSETSLRSFIGDGSNYTVKYYY